MARKIRKKKPSARRGAKAKVRKVARKPIRPKIAKRPVRKAAKPKKIARPKPAAGRAMAEMPAVEGKIIGKISHFYDKIRVGVIELSGSLRQGDRIAVQGHGNYFEQKVESMQVEHEQLAAAKAGQAIGLKLAHDAKRGDLVYKL